MNRAAGIIVVENAAIHDHGSAAAVVVGCRNGQVDQTVAVEITIGERAAEAFACHGGLSFVVEVAVEVEYGTYITRAEP